MRRSTPAMEWHVRCLASSDRQLDCVVRWILDTAGAAMIARAGLRATLHRARVCAGSPRRRPAFHFARNIQLAAEDFAAAVRVLELADRLPATSAARTNGEPHAR